ncbi:hypothetical protein [Tumebacillus flagellatus]|nr:hypothetical protein [Tumebacillus flagellatus]
MSNQWRSQARQMMGQPIVVRQQDGQVTQGILRKVDDRGLHVQPMGGARFASVMKQKANGAITQAVANEKDAPETEQVFFAAWFLILYALIAGLWAWGAYPGYGYGRGYGYGGYGGYGYGPGYGAGYRRRGLYW